MVLLDLQIFPNDKGESLTPYVARCVDVIDKSGLNYRFAPMGTTIEGHWDEVMAVVTGCYKALEKDCNRITINIRIDYRAGNDSRLKSKLTSVEGAVGRTLNT
jgi:uncharacterized protein (TIGR00106 family)